jgi:Flp pilus assembly protein TadG
VEFSISVVLLLVLLFGIITFGLILSFKQGLTQATAEGARAGAVVSETDAPAVAAAAAADGVGAFNKACGSGGLTCTYVVAPCASAPLTKCITVKMVYDYKNHPLLPPLPGVGLVVPDTLSATSVAQVNP